MFICIPKWFYITPAVLGEFHLLNSFSKTWYFLKKAEHWRIDAFELWCWRRLLRVPWTASRSNQSILKEINPGISLEGMMLKLKLLYLATSCKELTHWKRLWCWEGLGAREEEDDRGWDGWMASQTRWMWVWVNSRSWWWTGRPGVLWFMGSKIVGHDWATELNWTETRLGKQISTEKKRSTTWKLSIMFYSEDLSLGDSLSALRDSSKEVMEEPGYIWVDYC